VAPTGRRCIADWQSSAGGAGERSDLPVANRRHGRLQNLRYAFSLVVTSHLTFDAGFELGIHVQNVLCNPPAGGLMQPHNNFVAETFRPVARFEVAEKVPEPFMGLFVDGMGGAPVTFHALLLKLKMRFRVGFKKINQMDQEIAFLPGWIGDAQHLLQMIDVVDQHPVLKINLVRAGRKLFSPGYHDDQTPVAGIGVNLLV
jgi:hypothetical protein